MSIYIEPYSAKSFVVRGDTKSRKEEIEKIGGKFNNRLTDKKTGEKFSAFIFPNTKKDFVEKWLNTGEIDESLVSKYNYSSSNNDNNKVSSTNSINIKLIMERLKKLEEEVKYLRSKVDDGEESEYEEVVVETDEEDEEEEPVKLRKLL